VLRKDVSDNFREAPSEKNPTQEYPRRDKQADSKGYPNHKNETEEGDQRG
jgi:hypothetical protein